MTGQFFILQISYFHFIHEIQNWFELQYLLKYQLNNLRFNIKFNYIGYILLMVGIVYFCALICFLLPLSLIMTSLSLNATFVFSPSVQPFNVNLESESKRDKLKLYMLYKYQRVDISSTVYKNNISHFLASCKSAFIRSDSIAMPATSQIFTQINTGRYYMFLCYCTRMFMQYAVVTQEVPGNIYTQLSVIMR